VSKSALNEIVEEVRKDIGSIAVVAALVYTCFIPARINDLPLYHFNGRIGEESVTCAESPWFGKKTVLTVKKPDGTIVELTLTEDHSNYTLALTGWWNGWPTSGGRGIGGLENDVDYYLAAIAEANVAKSR